MNNQKGFASIVLIVLVVVLAGALGYVTLIKKPASVEQPQTNNSQILLQGTKNPPVTAKIIDWDSLIPDIRTVLDQTLSYSLMEGSRSISIYKKVDVTGDGIPEVLIDLGAGGPGPDVVTLVRMENNKPIASLFKWKGGNISTGMFPLYENDAGHFGSDTDVIESKNAIYSAHFSTSENLSSCGAEAYQWNPQTKVFEFNSSLSSEVKQNYCSKICSELAIKPDLKVYFQRICR